MSDDYSTLGFVETAEDAQKRFEQFESLDPLQDIQPALLNSGDVYDYARITGMVWPFEKDKLKSASYEVPFLGDVHYVDKDGVSQHRKIQKEDRFELGKNSIAFVFLETTFRLPDYMAIRFNLKITHVHRGLLLGTGPLVDPGFAGRLLVPLHNLTSKECVLYGGHGLIWIEFTKLSPHRRWSNQARTNGGEYKPFPPDKRFLSAAKYFQKASDGIPAESSIPGEIKTAKESAEEAKIVAKQSAEEAKSTVDEIRKKIRDYALLGGLALGVGIAGVLAATWNLISTANNNIANASIAATNFRDEQIKFQKRIDDMEVELKRLRASAPQTKKQSSASLQKVDSVDMQLKVFSHPASDKTSAAIQKENN